MSGHAARIVSDASAMSNPKDFKHHVSINVGEVAHSQSQEFSSKSYGAYERHIYRAASLGDWNEAAWYGDKAYPDWVSTPLTPNRDTALHVAVSTQQTSFVAKLVERISKQDMEIPKTDGNTAFCVAAISGNVKIATILLNKNRNLVWIRGHKEMLPIQLATLAGRVYMVEFLFNETKKDMHTLLPFQGIVKLFFMTLTSNIYSVALGLLDGFPKLANTENEEGLNALQVLAQSSFQETAHYYLMLRTLFKNMEKEVSLQSVRTIEAMFGAAKSGNTLILEYIFYYYPSLLMEVNAEGRSLLHIAILYRQESVYDLILSKGAYNNILMQHVDKEGNNVLHLAGKLTEEERFGLSSDQVLIRSEEEWFQGLEDIVPPALKTKKNDGNLTPKELFKRDHKVLSREAVSELYDMANNFIVVATLLISLGITAALTIRTNPISGKTLLFSHKTMHVIFLLSNASGVCLCTIALLCFSSVLLPSKRGTGAGYVKSRQAKMTYGCFFTFSSIIIMGIFSVPSATFLIFHDFPKWFFFACVPLLCGLPAIFLGLLFHYHFDFALRLMLETCQRFAEKTLPRMVTKFKKGYLDEKDS